MKVFRPWYLGRPFVTINIRIVSVTNIAIVNDKELVDGVRSATGRTRHLCNYLSSVAGKVPPPE